MRTSCLCCENSRLCSAVALDCKYARFAVHAVNAVHSSQPSLEKAFSHFLERAKMSSPADDPPRGLCPPGYPVRKIRLGLGGAPPGVFGTWGCPYGVLGLGASHSSLERPPRSVLDPLGASLAFSSTRGSLLIDILCACLIEPTVLLVSQRIVKKKVRTGSKTKNWLRFKPGWCAVHAVHEVHHHLL